MKREPVSRETLEGLYRTIAVRTLVALAASNIVGAVIVYTYVAYVVPLADTTSSIGSSSGLYLLFAYVAVTVPLITVAALRSARPVLAWVEANRPATPSEKVLVLDQPYIQTRYTFRAWLGAAVVFLVFNVLHHLSFADCVRVALSTILGGLTTSAFCFLVVERLHRPGFAAALADGELPERHGMQIRSRLLLIWVLGSGVPFAGIILAPAARRGAGDNALIVPVVVLAVIGLFVGLVLTSISARSVTDPLDELREGLERVAGGDLDAHIPVDDGGELGALEAGYNRMLSGLRERNRLADLFGRHVGVEVARRAIENGVALGGQLREMSILFVDMIGSTNLAVRREPDEVVELLNAFFGVIVTVVEDNHGAINRFDGDGALCTFGALEDDRLHASNALKAARELSTALRVLAARHPEIRAGIGVSSGMAVAGNIGARQRVEYTVIGDPVNEASRLTDLAKGYASCVLASSRAVFSAIGPEQDRWDYVGAIALRGRDELTETYEPVPTSGRR
ncbi:MAG: adenylate cyclase [Actinomycetota bacterium]